MVVSAVLRSAFNCILSSLRDVVCDTIAAFELGHHRDHNSLSSHCILFSSQKVYNATRRSCEGFENARSIPVDQSIDDDEFAWHQSALRIAMNLGLSSNNLTVSPLRSVHIPGVLVTGLPASLCPTFVLAHYVHCVTEIHASDLHATGRESTTYPAGTRDGPSELSLSGETLHDENASPLCSHSSQSNVHRRLDVSSLSPGTYNRESKPSRSTAPQHSAKAQTPAGPASPAHTAAHHFMLRGPTSTVVESLEPLPTRLQPTEAPVYASPSDTEYGSESDCKHGRNGANVDAHIFDKYEIDDDVDIYIHMAPLPPDADPVGILHSGRTRYRLYGLLGDGSFGRVFLAEAENDTTGGGDEGSVFVAVKIIEKISLGDVEHTAGLVENEVRLMGMAVGGLQRDGEAEKGWERGAAEDPNGKIGGVQSPFLAHLLECWEDPDNVYLVMRFYPRSLHSLLNEVELEPYQTKLYCAQLALALHDMHTRLHAFHRDIKSGNVLIDFRGNLVLCDFGGAHFPLFPPSVMPSTAVSSSLPSPPSSPPPANIEANLDAAFSAAVAYDRHGTTGYFAPELIARDLASRGYTAKADVYSLGMTFWEMMTGSLTPDYDSLPTYLKARTLLEDNIEWMQDAEAIDLITKMLDEDPKTRLSIQDILAHPYFSDVDLEALRDGSYDMPYKPDPIPRCYVGNTLAFFDYEPSYRGQYFTSSWRCAPERVRDARHGEAHRTPPAA
ncbi:hypothetical protein POSPLADRAFT_1160767 [Postia placenta MAD-698-R-SB12]|uniref:non-specific serine/threonine protein kinase n=1 Tax=Postia placenta MAD-698-R-SB12 TaxID=670580 RepID=A0A1X6MJ26_9APHY|nr:hypothetical protein POSPLADRAFT_1160767 [Postia placenta MAD-698-R-SB12]OSX56152.1 hypothetical protein POSPLADRAFT_1160767 [Postia placenta MAD-698-R-SB12]